MYTRAGCTHPSLTQTLTIILIQNITNPYIFSFQSQILLLEVLWSPVQYHFINFRSGNQLKSHERNNYLQNLFHIILTSHVDLLRFNDPCRSWKVEAPRLRSWPFGCLNKESCPRGSGTCNILSSALIPGCIRRLGSRDVQCWGSTVNSYVHIRTRHNRYTILKAKVVISFNKNTVFGDIIWCVRMPTCFGHVWPSPGRCSTVIKDNRIALTSVQTQISFVYCGSMSKISTQSVLW